MTPKYMLQGLSLELPYSSPQAANFLPPTWPPTEDFPIVIDANGVVTARYGDSVWDLTPWRGQVRRLNFRDGKNRKNTAPISKDNANIFRLIVASWLYTSGSIQSSRTLITRFEQMVSIFTFCTSNKILISDLARFPILLEKLPNIISSSAAGSVINILHDLWEKRDLLGFHILSANEIRRLAECFTKHKKTQTSYIPPRIWTYQVMRLRLALDEFLRHKEAITACYNYCLELYSAASGSLAKACQNPPIEKDAPLTRKYRPVNTPANSQEYMIFTDVAKKFGIYDLLDEWIGHKQGIGVFSQYFAFITTVGTAYIVNFTMMRIDETHSLRTDCFSSETDPSTNEKIYIIKGETTKTLQDDDARWITSPSVAVAVEAMTIVAHLKTIAAKANPDVSLTEEDVTNPYLILRPYEPWRKQSRNISQPTKIRPAPKNYSTAVGKMKKLFNPKELEITPDDFEVARRITPDINPETFRIGEPWPLAWHQLRRTGAVNMLASGLVTDASLQYQLKHVSRTMTRYYASGYYSASFKLNGEARSEYIREMYVNAAREISSLRSERFVSPHGEKRKKQLFNLIAVKDHTELVRAAKQGNLPYRATILGGCANPAPCSYGGIDCIVHCAGGDGSPACEHALYDRSSVKKLLILKNETEQRLRSSTDGSPLRTALEYQITALDNVLHAIT